MKAVAVLCVAFLWVVVVDAGTMGSDGVCPGGGSSGNLCRNQLTCDCNRGSDPCVCGNPGPYPADCCGCQCGHCDDVCKCRGVTCPTLSQCHNQGTCNNENGQCEHTFKSNGSPCDDGNPLLGNDQCIDGQCVGTDLCAGGCTPSDQCHDAGTCDPADGSCTDPEKTDGSACDDGDGTTNPDTCQAGVCGGIPRCQGVECPETDCGEAGTCDPLTGECVRTPKADGLYCIDGDSSTGGDKCLNGVCIGSIRHMGFDGVCPGGGSSGSLCRNQLTCDCDRSSDPCMCGNSGSSSCCGCQCGHCDDVCRCRANGISCSGTACMSAGTCDDETLECLGASPINEGGACDDGVLETVQDTCTSGVCAGVDLCAGGCAAPAVCKADGVCDYHNGQCSYANLADGTACDDSDDTTENDQCSAGVCAGTQKCDGVTCEGDEESCIEAPTCEPTTGECVGNPKPDGTYCIDGDASTGGDQCIGGVCAGSSRHMGFDGVCPGGGSSGSLCRNQLTCDCDRSSDPCVCGNSGSSSCCGCQCGHCDDVCRCRANGISCVATTCLTGGTCDDETLECVGQAPRNEGSACDDGNPDTVQDVCTSGVCAGVDLCAGGCAAPAVCKAQGECDHQNGQCSYANLADGTVCDDTDDTTENDQCTAGVCAGTPKCDGVTCDGVEESCIEAPTCEPTTGECVGNPKPDGTYCIDGDASTGGDKCTGGVCAGSIRHMDFDGYCPGGGSSGGLCIGQLTCDCDRSSDPCVCGNSGSSSCCGCQCGHCDDVCRCRANGISCPDGVCMTGGVCDNETLECINKQPRNVGGSCDDGDPITVNDACEDDGVCRGEDLCEEGCPSLECHDAGSCDQQTGDCTYNADPDGTACDDEDDTTENDSCTAGVCAGTQKCDGVDCSGDETCFSDAVCEPTTGECVGNTPKPDGTYCIDGNPSTGGDTCTGGVCSGSENHMGFDGICPGGGDSGGLCIGQLTCDCDRSSNPCMCGNSGSSSCCGCQCGHCDDVCRCRANGISCVADTCSTAGTCDDETLECVGRSPINEGGACDDGDSSTGNDVCTNGVCQGEDLCAAPCDPQDQCHSAACDTQTGICHQTPLDGTDCNNNDPTSRSDVCVTGVCVSTPFCDGVTCTALDQCHEVGTCEPTSGICSDPPSAAGTDCDDGDDSNFVDSCDGAGVCSGRTDHMDFDGICPGGNNFQSCVGQHICDCTRQEPCTCGAPTDEHSGCCNCSCGYCEDVCRCKENNVDCSQLDDACNVGVCDNSDLSCSATPIADGTVCDDGNQYSQNDQCTGGVCAGVECPGGCSASDMCHEGFCFEGACDERLTNCDDSDPSTFDLCDPDFLGCYNPERCLDVGKYGGPWVDNEGLTCADYNEDSCLLNNEAQHHCCVCGGGELNIKYSDIATGGSGGDVTVDNTEILAGLDALSDKLDRCDLLKVDSPDKTELWEGEFVRVMGEERNGRPVYCQFPSSATDNICLFYAIPSNMPIALEGWVLKRGYDSEDWPFEAGYGAHTQGIEFVQQATGQWGVGASNIPFWLNIICV